MVKLQPTTDGSQYERLIAVLIESQTYTGVAEDEVSVFLGEDGWQLVLTKGGKWRIE
jgi:hypothetical protein